MQQVTRSEPIPSVRLSVSENTVQNRISRPPNPRTLAYTGSIQFPTGIANAQYNTFAATVIANLYPKFCAAHSQPLTKLVSTRQYSIRCSQPACRQQASLFSHTPLHHFKLPPWMFGWALHESIARYPQVLSASEIERRLGIAKNSALLLKRRLQLFASDQMEKIKPLMQTTRPCRFVQSTAKGIRKKPTGYAEVKTIIEECLIVTRSHGLGHGLYHWVGI